MALFGRSRRRPYRKPVVRAGANALAVAPPKEQAGEPGSLTASGERVNRQRAESIRQLSQPWQARSFAYYDVLGEIKYAGQFYARMLAPLRLYVAELDENNEWVETDDEKAIATLDRIQDPGGGTSKILASYGRLMFLTGEAYLMGTKDPDGDGEAWEVLSTDELRPQDGSYVRYKAPSLAPQELKEPSDEDFEPIDEDHAYVYRLWQSSPRFSQLADATMQGVLDLCEELVLLTQAVRSRARSRLAGAGVLFIDDRISPAPPEPGPDEDPEEDIFLSDLIEAITTAIVDEGAASAVVPHLVRVPVPEGMTLSDMVYHLQVVDPMQLYPETGLRFEIIRRIAIGLDMPPEILTGTGDVNHWGSWQIDEQTWKGHGAPKADQFVDDLTGSYFRPTLKAAKHPKWNRFRVLYDASAVINHPDRFKDAKEAWDRGAIGLKPLRDAGGFKDNDAPTQEDRAERIGIAVRDPSLAWFGIPSVRSGGLEPFPGEIVQGGDPTMDGDGGAATGADVQKGPPADPDKTVGPAVIGALAVHRIRGAADFALLRCREAAGARLRTLVRRDKEALALIEGLSGGEVPAKLGLDRVRALRGPSERELVAGARPLIIDTLRMYEITGSPAEQIADQIEQHAARTLYSSRPAPLPASFVHYIAGLAREVTPA